MENRSHTTDSYATAQTGLSGLRNAKLSTPQSYWKDALGESAEGSQVHGLHEGKSSQVTQVMLHIDSGQQNQELIGFGASFTDSAAYLINTVLPAEQREKVMTALFDPKKGIGLSALRNPMGASDYARFIYSYDDVEPGSTDPNLSQFTLEHDEQDIIPLTKKARELNSQLFLMASPWSAPAWMKTSGSMKAGKLKPEYRDVYARYFVRFLEEMKAHGLEVHAITAQNEPLYEPHHYPSMNFPADEEADFIHRYLAPAMREASLDTKILAYDHNWDHAEYPLEVLKTAHEDVAGVAWHWYGGEASQQKKVTELYPHTDAYCTEASGGSWIPEPSMPNLASQIIKALTYGSRTFILWNMALDENNGPTVPGFGESTCRGLFLVNTATRTATPTIDFYGLAHFSSVLRPGARILVPRVEEQNCDNSDRLTESAGASKTSQALHEESPVQAIAARNLDGSLGVVVLNGAEHDVVMSVDATDSSSPVEQHLLVPAQSVLSFQLTTVVDEK